MNTLIKPEVCHGILEEYCTKNNIDYQKVDVCEIAKQEGLPTKVIESIMCLMFYKTEEQNIDRKVKDKIYDCLTFLTEKYYKEIEKTYIIPVIKKILEEYSKLSIDKVNTLLEIYASVEKLSDIKNIFFGDIYDCIENRPFDKRILDLFLKPHIENYGRYYPEGPKFAKLHSMVRRQVLGKEHIDEIISTVLDKDATKFFQRFKDTEKKIAATAEAYRAIKKEVLDILSEYEKHEEMDFSKTVIRVSSKRGRGIYIEFEVKVKVDSSVAVTYKFNVAWWVHEKKTFYLDAPTKMEKAVKLYTAKNVLEDLLEGYKKVLNDATGGTLYYMTNSFNILRETLIHQMLTTRQLEKILSYLVPLQTKIRQEFEYCHGIDTIEDIINTIRKNYGISTNYV